MNEGTDQIDMTDDGLRSNPNCPRGGHRANASAPPRRDLDTDRSGPPSALAGPPEIDCDVLGRHLSNAGMMLQGRLTAEPISGGRSNLTFRLSDSASNWILRRPPIGHVLATAHDMRREFVVLRALEQTAIPSPAAIHLCEDPQVIGAQFMIMEFLQGTVVDNRQAAGTLTEDQAKRASEALIDVLAEIHTVDPAAIGLSEFGRPIGFLTRQIRRWQRQWANSVDAPSPLFDELASRLEAAVPARSGSSLVHGDYRLGNVILASQEPGRIAGVIDWELSTLGDPLADLGLLLAYWDPASADVTAGGHPVIANPGFLTPDQLIERYTRQCEVQPSDLDFYRVFGFFKLAAIAQTIVARHRKGLAIGDGLPAVANAVDKLIEAGWRHATRLPGQ